MCIPILGMKTGRFSWYRGEIHYHFETFINWGEKTGRCLAHLVSLCICNTGVIIDVTSNPQFASDKLITSSIKVQTNANSFRVNTKSHQVEVWQWHVQWLKVRRRHLRCVTANKCLTNLMVKNQDSVLPFPAHLWIVRVHAIMK